MSSHLRRPLFAFVALTVFPIDSVAAGDWGFIDVTATAGVDFDHGYDIDPPPIELFLSGGAAAGDFDRDGWPDLYVIRGDLGTNLLLRNRGDGTFEDLAADAGVNLFHRGSGPAFADLDGDGWLDLFVGTARSTSPSMFRNRGDGTFEDMSEVAAFPSLWVTSSASFGDYDNDGDLDLFLAQWNQTTAELLWRNDGNFTFAPVTKALLGEFHDFVRSTFTANWTDLDHDGDLDLAIASDFGRSKVLHGIGGTSFIDVTDPTVITDEHGMGAAIGDYDNDGDLDWFVTSIHYAGPLDPGTGVTGNRMYRNIGDGSFEDATDEAGVRAGFWGWGTCFADFDNDGDLDLFQTNGWRRSNEVFFDDDPSRLFVNQGDGSFSEESLARGLDDREQGRSPVCFDYDRDGDLDLFVFKNSGPMRLYRNDGGNARGHFRVHLAGSTANTEGIGARIVLQAGEGSQLREMRSGSNYLSQNPAVAHFGIGSASLIEELTIEWPNGTDSKLVGLIANQQLRVEQGVLFSSGFETGDLRGWASAHSSNSRIPVTGLPFLLDSHDTNERTMEDQKSACHQTTDVRNTDQSPNVSM